jgi:hypothetical protein
VSRWGDMVSWWENAVSQWERCGEGVHCGGGMPCHGGGGVVVVLLCYGSFLGGMILGRVQFVFSGGGEVFYDRANLLMFLVWGAWCMFNWRALWRVLRPLRGGAGVFNLHRVHMFTCSRVPTFASSWLVCSVFT